MYLMHGMRKELSKKRFMTTSSLSAQRERLNGGEFMKDLPSYSAWYEITLLDCGPNKVKVIKLVREYRGLRLVEAKHLVENLPQVVACVSGSRLQDAERCKAEFEALGATVTMELEFPTYSGPGYYEE